MARKLHINVSNKTAFIDSCIIEACLLYNGQLTHYKYLAALHAKVLAYDSEVLHLEWRFSPPNNKLRVLEVRKSSVYFTMPLVRPYAMDSVIVEFLHRVASLFCFLGLTLFRLFRSDSEDIARFLIECAVLILVIQLIKIFNVHCHRGCALMSA